MRTHQPLRLVAVGCGRVFERFHFPALLATPDWTLVAAVDKAAERLRWVSRGAPSAALAGSLAELPGDLQADAMLVCSPPDTHCAVAAEALQRGMHVLIETPMVLRSDEAASLLQLARSAGRQLLVGFNRRLRPAYLRLRQRLQAAADGELRGVTYLLRSDPAAWGAVAGEVGVLDDLASHQLDLVPWLTGRPVEEVRARMAHPPGGGAIEIELRLAGGIAARCHAEHAAGSAELLEVRLARGAFVADHGSVASARWAPDWLAHRYLRARTLTGGVVRRARRRPGYRRETFSRQLAAWAGALRGRLTGEPADGAAGARCVELVEACRHSLAVGGAWIRTGSAEPAR